MTDKDKQNWKRFKESGLLWWVNRSLHLFGWAIIVEQNERGEVVSAYPSRVVYRGFNGKDEEFGFVRVAQYLEANSKTLLDEIE